MIFKYSEYKEFLLYLNGLGKIVPFKDWNKSEKVFILRHDVDMDIDIAYRLALIENELNVKSTFFILVSSELYNVQSKSNRHKLKEMHRMGFEIGLHFDPTVYDNQELLQEVKRESDILSNITGTKVTSISLHNPSVYNEYPMFDGYINAYDPEIFNNDCYITDSRMKFSGKDIYDFAKNIKDTSVQISLHPMHFSETGYGYDGIIKDFIINNINKADKIFRVNTTYNQQVSRDFLIQTRILKDKE